VKVSNNVARRIANALEKLVASIGTQNSRLLRVRIGQVTGNVVTHVAVDARHFGWRDTGLGTFIGSGGRPTSGWQRCQIRPHLPPKPRVEGSEYIERVTLHDPMDAATWEFHDWRLM